MKKDIIQEFQELIDSVKPLREGPYHFSELLSDYPGHSHLVMNQLYQRFNTNPYGYCFPILIEKALPSSDELNIYTLVDIVMMDSYSSVIPDNGFAYSCDLKKVDLTKIQEPVEIKLMGQKVQVYVDIQKFTFKISNVKNINFPDDYFLKGIPLLAEQLSKQFIPDDPSQLKKISYKNENFGLIKNIVISRIISKKIKGS